MDVDRDLIWGNDGESEVFAQAQSQAQSQAMSIIFKHSLNPKLPQSLPSRVVTCYHELPAEACETFPDLTLMREALWSSIRGVWDQCIRHPSVAAPDVTVEIYEDGERQQWRISHESLYNQYVESLSPVSSFFRPGERESPAYNSVDYSRLAQIEHLGGRGRTAVVRSSQSSDALYVFKGVEFGAFLESPGDFHYRRDTCYYEIRTIASLPKHPNIIPPPNTLVTVREIGDDRQAFVCGTLYPFMEHGTLDDQIQIPRLPKPIWR